MGEEQTARQGENPQARQRKPKPKENRKNIALKGNDLKTYYPSCDTSFAGGFISTTDAGLAVSLLKLSKIFEIGETRIEVLKQVDLRISPGEFVAIFGASGSGKTTLLNLICGIDKPTGGEITVFNENLEDKDEDSLADLRCRRIGYVFQSYNLVSTLTVAENVAFPMEWNRKPVKEIEDRVAKLLQMLGLTNRMNHFPIQLSGGEQQRVAFARSLANDPPLLLADEPTGNLDADNTHRINDLLRTLKAEGKTIIVSTHERELMRFADQRLLIEDGRLIEYNE